MTDLERFKELYRSFGIILTERLMTDSRFADPIVVITMEAHEHPKFKGYGGFGSDVTFDLEGNFIEQGFWE
jgi:hypothetical protein